MSRFVLLALLLLAVAPRALAHAFLAKASPPVGSQMPVAPAELTLRFTEGVEPLFWKIELISPSGAAVAIPAPKVAGDRQMLVVSLPKIQPGTYTVVWHVTSVD